MTVPKRPAFALQSRLRFRAAEAAACRTPMYATRVATARPAVASRPSTYAITNAGALYCSPSSRIVLATAEMPVHVDTFLGFIRKIDDAQQMRRNESDDRGIHRFNPFVRPFSRLREMRWEKRERCQRTSVIQNRCAPEPIHRHAVDGRRQSLAAQVQHLTRSVCPNPWL